MKWVKIYTSEEKGFDESKRYRGTYLHGILEGEKGFDIFSIDTDDTIPVGLNSFINKDNGKELVLMLWMNKDQTDKDIFRGYMIYVDDPDFDYCLTHYKNKSSIL